MDWLQEKLKAMSLLSCNFEKICGGSLTGKQQDFALRANSLHLNGEVNTGHLRHDHI
jgi:hypothetical protein